MNEKETNLKINTVDIYSASNVESYGHESDENDTFCGFCHIKYCDPISAKLDD
jgi:hypothetical protein